MVVTLATMWVKYLYILKECFWSEIKVTHDTLAWERGVAGRKTRHLSIHWESELYAYCIFLQLIVPSKQWHLCGCTWNITPGHRQLVFSSLPLSGSLSNHRIKASNMMHVCKYVDREKDEGWIISLAYFNHIASLNVKEHKGSYVVIRVATIP